MDINNKQKAQSKDIKLLLAYDFIEKLIPNDLVKKSFNELTKF